MVTFSQPLPVAWTAAGILGLALAVFGYRFRHRVLPGYITGIYPNLPMVSIGGVPRAGKSTLFQNFSGEAGSLNVGRDTADYVLSDELSTDRNVQIFDCPGDCPKEINQKFRGSLDTLVFVFDPSEGSYPAESQKDFMDSLKEELDPRITIPIINSKPGLEEDKVEDIQSTTSQDLPVLDLSEGGEELKKMLEMQFSESVND